MTSVGGEKLNYSNEIEGFLNFLREAEREYRQAVEEESIKNSETQDLDHRLELNDDSYHDCAKLARALRNVRRERRKAKNTKIMTEPIYEWYGQNKKIICSIERLLGEVRKAEKSTENRFYTDRTEIVKNTLGNEKEKSPCIGVQGQ